MRKRSKRLSLVVELPLSLVDRGNSSLPAAAAIIIGMSWHDLVVPGLST